MRKLLIVGSLSVLSFSVFAADAIKYTCTSGSAERVIEVSYSTAEAVPCEVNYTKDGETKSLWTFENTTGQCETKAAEFVEKQRGWGWTCSEPTVPDAAPKMISDPEAEMKEQHMPKETMPMETMPDAEAPAAN